MLKQELEKTISTYWWNYGKKKKDYTGTYAVWFKNNNIKIKESKSDYKLNFRGQYGSMKFNITLTKDYIHSFNTIIKICLSHLGDKAMIIDCYGREYKVNWR